MYISHIRSVRPRYTLTQETSHEWLKASIRRRFPDEADQLIERFDKVACKPESIAQRSTEVIDYATENRSQWRIHAAEKGLPSAPLEQRLELYDEAAGTALEKLFEEPQHSPSALIHVTCTGYLSPSPAQKLALNKGWGATTPVYHAYHMGCYAAFPALTQASALLSLPKGLASVNDTPSVEVAHTELCSMHLNLDDRSAEKFVIQSLFADGHIAYRITPEPVAEARSLKVIALLEKSVPDTTDAMTWIPTAGGFAMTLSKAVPIYIKRSIREYMSELSEKSGLELGSLLKEACFAIHPGGPKVIDLIASQLELSEDQISASRKVLLNHGNMSSATLPHVWEEILKTTTPKTYVVAMAFGPGLTISGGVFQVQ